MIHEAQVHLAGYVATEPRFKKVAGDTSSVRLRVAYTARRRDKETGEWGDGPTSFVAIQCWRTLADNVSMSVHKGEPVLIMGRLQIRRFEDAQGASRTAVEVEASSVGHDLTRGVAQFSRTRWPAAAAAAEAAALSGAAPGSEDGAMPGDGAELADGLESAERPNGATNGGAPAGDGMIDERAVAEFARELSESLGAAAAADPAANGTEDAGTAAGTGLSA
jgi:single-strand DNA-binding protein